MLIPSIDLMGGKIVQLVQGTTRKVESRDFRSWISRFTAYPMVQLIDLDAAMGQGDNHALVIEIVSQLPCQVGGGLRSLDVVRQLIASGARRVIIGSALVQDGEINSAFAAQLCEQVGPERLVFAVDSRAGRVAVDGWRRATSLAPETMMRTLEPYCSAFLYTHIDTEGLMAGFPLAVARYLRAQTTRQLIVAGGIASQDEVQALDEVGADAVVGMAIYTGAMGMPQSSPRSS
jgi:phosphoribosylformimino-5-aminoimidazole carboxamide ribotide isomerase